MREAASCAATPLRSLLLGAAFLGQELERAKRAARYRGVLASESSWLELIVGWLSFTR